MIQLHQSVLEETRTAYLERLALWLDVLPDRMTLSYEGKIIKKEIMRYRHELIRAILRREKELSRMSRAKRCERP